MVIKSQYLRNLILIVAFPTLSYAGAQYAITLLPYPYGGSGAGGAITNSGTILDYVSNPPAILGAYWILHGAAIEPVYVPNNLTFDGSTMNDEDAIVGTAYSDPPSGGVFSPALAQGGNFTILSNPFAPEGSTNAQADTINNSNQVAGFAMNAAGQAQAVEWQFGYPILLQPDSYESNAFSINDNGWIAGFVTTDDNLSDTVPVIWHDNQAQQLNMPAGAVSGQAELINNNNQVVCVANLLVPGTQSVRQEYYLWDDGNIIPLAFPGNQIPNPADYGMTQAEDINNLGVIVGISYDRAVIWQDGAITDLNSLIDPNSGWTLIGAASINDNGDIVGVGENNGLEEGFLLTPIPEPAIILPAAGFCLLAARRRR